MLPLRLSSLIVQVFSTARTDSDLRWSKTATHADFGLPPLAKLNFLKLMLLFLLLIFVYCSVNEIVE